MPATMAETETINTTALARDYQLTTKDLEKRLRKLGIAPVSEVIMPSGRRFILWPAAEARKALDGYRDSLKEKRDAAFGRTPGAPPTAPEKPQEIDELRQEVSEVKDLLSQLLQRLADKDKPN